MTKYQGITQKKSPTYGIVYISAHQLHTRWCKIGYSGQIGGSAGRVKSYSDKHGTDSWYVYKEYQCYYPRSVESKVHQKLKRHKVKNSIGAREIFDIRPEEAERIVIEEIMRIKLEFECQTSRPPPVEDRYRRESFLPDNKIRINNTRPPVDDNKYDSEPLIEDCLSQNPIYSDNEYEEFRKNMVDAANHLACS